MKIGITGSRGFIGSHIAAFVRAKKGTRVFSFDLPQQNMLDAAQVAAFIKDKDVIIHAAAVNRGTDTEVIAGTVVSTFNLIEAMRRLKKKPKLIFLSSVQAETDSLYGRAKLLAETMLQDYAQTHKAPIAVFRLANVFGEGCRPFYNSVIATFCHQLARGEKLAVNPSDKKFNFVYVNDVAALVVKEVGTRRAKPFYFKRVTSKDAFTVTELATLLTRLAKLPSARGLKSKFEKDLFATYQSYVQ